MKSTLTLRADCSSVIGTGHVMRMIALGQAWLKTGGSVQFIGNIKPLAERLNAEGFSVHQLSSVYPDPKDLQTLLSKTSPNSWIVLDGYHFDNPFQTSLRKTRRKLIVVDDICDKKEYHADILLNQNLDGPTYKYATLPETQLLLGPRYTLLRKEFLNYSPPNGREQLDQINLLITLGGSDSLNLTPRVLEAAREVAEHPLYVKVIAGPAHPAQEQLRQSLKTAPFPCKLISATNDMAALMRWADIAITAAGSTCWELCFSGVPFIAIKIAANQKGIIHELKKDKTALCLDSTASLRDIATQLETLITSPYLSNSMREKGQRLIDGNGAKRVVNAIEVHGLRLRKVIPEDSEVLLLWRNDPITRANSINSDEIPLELHQAWFKKKLEDESCLFFVAETNEGMPIGQIRFDRQSDTAILSISVAPAMHGRGFGTKITQLGCNKLTQNWPGIDAVALVKPENIPSALMFEKAGFIKQPMPKKDLLCFVWSVGINNE